MTSLVYADLPLATKNRLGYAPPRTELVSGNGNIEHISISSIDLPGQSSQPPEDLPKPPKAGTIYTLVSTTYSLLILAFFKTLLDSLKGRQLPEKETEETDSKLRSEAIPETVPQTGFPGESTPINNSFISGNPNFIQGDSVNTAQKRTHLQKPNQSYKTMYDTLFELDTSDDDEIDVRLQYGTTLQISEASKYVPCPELPPAPHSGPFADVTATELLDTEFPTMDEYDKVVHKFYAPSKPFPLYKYSLTDAMLSAIPSYKFSQFLKTERDRVQKLIFQERKAAESSIQPLSKAQLSAVEKVWNSRLQNDRIASEFAIDVSSKDLKTLADGCWLNDNVIDFYLNLVAARTENIFCWTTHFFSTLKSKGYTGVARWAKRKKVNLLEKDLVIVPVNINSMHWALAVIDNQKKLIGYYDSLASRGNIRALELLSEYMAKESERLQMPEVTYTLNANLKTPQQLNGFDCGVFTCTTAKHLAEKKGLTFSQKDMPLIRRRMAYEIISKSLLGGALEHHL